MRGKPHPHFIELSDHRGITFAVCGDQAICALQASHLLWTACDTELNAIMTRVCFDPLIRFSFLHEGQATKRPVPLRRSILCIAHYLREYRAGVPKGAMYPGNGNR